MRSAGTSASSQVCVHPPPSRCKTQSPRGASVDHLCSLGVNVARLHGSPVLRCGSEGYVCWLPFPQPHRGASICHLVWICSFGVTWQAWIGS